MMPSYDVEMMPQLPNSRHLGFYDFYKTLKNTQKCENVYNILHLKTTENWKYEKHADKNMVTMETSRSLSNNMSYQIAPRQISGKVAKFGVHYFRTFN
jgi:hypothetical protein